MKNTAFNFWISYIVNVIVSIAIGAFAGYHYSSLLIGVLGFMIPSFLLSAGLITYFIKTESE